MSDNAERLRSWAQNEEMVDDRYTEHGRDCLNAADEIERLRFALDRIAHHGPPMGAYGDYRVGAVDMASTLSAIAREALGHE